MAIVRLHGVPLLLQVDVPPVRNVDGSFEPGEGTYKGNRVKLVVATELMSTQSPSPPALQLPSPLPVPVSAEVSTLHPSLSSSPAGLAGHLQQHPQQQQVKDAPSLAPSLLLAGSVREPSSPNAVSTHTYTATAAAVVGCTATGMTSPISKRSRRQVLGAERFLHIVPKGAWRGVWNGVQTGVQRGV